MDALATEFLNLRRLPGRLTSQQAGWILGYDEKSVQALVVAGLLNPLNGMNVGPLAFSASAIAALAKDTGFLERAEMVLSRATGDIGSDTPALTKAPSNLAPKVEPSRLTAKLDSSAAIPKPHRVEGDGKNKMVGGYSVKVSYGAPDPRKQTRVAQVLTKVVASSLMRTQAA
jgi:hypothetical protein